MTEAAVQRSKILERLHEEPTDQQQRDGRLAAASCRGQAAARASHSIGTGVHCQVRFHDGGSRGGRRRPKSSVVVTVTNVVNATRQRPEINAITSDASAPLAIRSRERRCQ